MYTIEHRYAVSLERIVSRLFNFNYCNRNECNLISADYFEYYPLGAAVIVFSYIYAKELLYDKSQLGTFSINMCQFLNILQQIMQTMK